MRRFTCRFAFALNLAALAGGLLRANSEAHAQAQNFQNPNVMFGNGPGNNIGAGPGGQQTTTGAAGGAANADFDTLIDLIQSTVAQETWAENGGGEAEMRPFPTGVIVDTAGTLKLAKSAAHSAELAERRGTMPPAEFAEGTDWRRASKLRYVSLPRLEREIVRRQEAHERLDQPMLALAGLQRIQYIFVYPETGDLVIAGPAGDWRADAFGRLVSSDTGQPIVRLDDLLTLLRRGRQSSQSFFGCAINPRQAALAETQAYLDKTSARPLEPRRRKEWLETIRTRLGRQDIEIFGIDPTSRVAQVLVEADVHMKLIGMGLEEGVDGVESYLELVQASGGQPSAMSVLRWWFALNYAAIRTSPDGDAYELVGDGVRVLSENELLAAQGQRIHTGQSDALNEQFADSFTAHYAALAQKYHVYGELRSIFDLALALAIIESEKLADKAGWQPSRLVDNERLRLPAWPAPREVETVANFVQVNRRQIVAGVSGGVMVDVAETLTKRGGTTSSAFASNRGMSPTVDDKSAIWWWDASE
jgi:hypothetical protein